MGSGPEGPRVSRAAGLVSRALWSCASLITRSSSNNRMSLQSACYTPHEQSFAFFIIPFFTNERLFFFKGPTHLYILLWDAFAKSSYYTGVIRLMHPLVVIKVKGFCISFFLLQKAGYRSGAAVPQPVSLASCVTCNLYRNKNRVSPKAPACSTFWMIALMRHNSHGAGRGPE